MEVISPFFSYQLKIRKNQQIVTSLDFAHSVFSQHSHHTLAIMRNFLLIFSLIHFALSESYSPRIVGGFNVTSFNGFTHQVSIRDAAHESSRFGSGHLCGGSLIDYDTVGSY